MGQYYYAVIEINEQKSSMTEKLTVNTLLLS